MSEHTLTECNPVICRSSFEGESWVGSHATTESEDIDPVEDVNYVPLFRGNVHLLLAIMSPGLIFWLTRSVIIPQFIAEYSLSFCCCMINFVASALLHHYPRNDQNRIILTQMDYTGIFLMIGGSALPSISAIATTDFPVMLTLIQWMGIAAGTVGSFAFNFVAASAPLRVVIYFSVASPYVYVCLMLYHIKCYSGVVATAMTLTLYFTGGVIYAIKAPNPYPHLFGFHELFHLFCAMALATTFIGNHKVTVFTNPS